MKNKQLILLTAALAVTGGAALWKYSQRSGAIGKVPQEVGSDLLSNFNPADVAAFTVKDATGEVTVEQKDGKWVVPARDGFPASIDAVNELRDNAYALKIGEVQRVGASKMGQLKLKNPSEGAPPEETGTLVSFRDSSGKEIKSFIAGKVMSADDSPPGAFDMSGGGPKSQYIKVVGTDSHVFKAREGFTRLETGVKGWLDKTTFMKVEKPKSYTVSGAQPAETWTISKDSESAPWSLQTPAPGEDFDPAKAALLSSAFSYVQFTDVLPKAEEAKAALDKPERTAVISTFDGFIYTVKVGAPDPENGDNRFMTFTVEGNFPETRTPPAPAEEGKPAETEEEKKAADEAFAKALEAKKKKLAEEQAVAGRIFSLSKPSLDPILKTRPDFMKDPAPDGVIQPNEPAVTEKPPLPPANPPRQRVEAVTPPISIPPAPEAPAKEKKPEATTPPVEVPPATPPPAAAPSPVPAPTETPPAEPTPAPAPAETPAPAPAEAPAAEPTPPAPVEQTPAPTPAQ